MTEKNKKLARKVGKVAVCAVGTVTTIGIAYIATKATIGGLLRLANWLTSRGIKKEKTVMSAGDDDPLGPNGHPLFVG